MPGLAPSTESTSGLIFDNNFKKGNAVSSVAMFCKPSPADCSNKETSTVAIAPFWFFFGV